MALLNENSLPPRIGYKAIRNWNDRDYWYVAASINDKLNVPVEIVFGDETIVVCTQFEAYEEIVGQIYNELVVDLNIDPTRILLISENADLTDIIKETATNLGKGLISYEWSLVFQYGIRLQTINNLLSLKDIRPKTNLSNKYFLNFNRRWRIHRPTFVALLCASGLLDKGHVSLGPSDEFTDTWSNVIHRINNLIKNNEALIKLVEDHTDEIKNIRPLYLDTNELSINRVRLHYDDIDANTTANLYKDTAFSVVNETYFFEKVGRFLSEKTFKPIAYHHPFILIGKPFSLKLLRELGYKTFHPFIDESYDEETDDVTRMQMILQEVKRLCSMSGDELQLFLKNIEHITDHNFDRLVKLSSYIHKKL
jgi:hypothetical protein